MGSRLRKPPRRSTAAGTAQCSYGNFCCVSRRESLSPSGCAWRSSKRLAAAPWAYRYGWHRRCSPSQACRASGKIWKGYAVQFDLFESPPPASAPTSSSPIIGLRVQMPRACPSCGSIIGVVGTSSGPHAHRITCLGCSAFCRWLAHREAAFIAAISKKFGAPSSPIVIRGGV
jgi:hypothetical protein